jgi:CelD/BcsL family acetyltransferase involved in cellulose biosynthesis
VAVQRFSVDELEQLVPHWDAAVDRTPGVDGFCSAAPWSFSAATSFPHADPPVLVGDGTAFCGLRIVRSQEVGQVLVGLDPVWGFASPVVGPPRAAAEALVARLALDDFAYALIAGQRADSALTGWIVRLLEDSHRLLRGPVQERLQVDLSDGVDAWMGRRSSRFRQRLRHLCSDAERRGVRFHDVSAMGPDALFDRILAVESRSWKGTEATGLADEDLAAFYRQMTVRLAARDQLRVLVAELDGADAGFILGGIRGSTYRGLQLSYAEAAAPLGLGHLLQFEQLRRLPGEGITCYDLGMDMPYKRRWADAVDETFAVVIAP